MLVKFTVENWKSFRDSATLSMVATGEKRHSERLSKIGRYGLSLLPVAMMYGGNASGKSNLFSALIFSKRLIVNGRQPEQPTGVRGFALSKKKSNQPTRFLYHIVINRDLETNRKGDYIYEYSIALNSKVIIEEKLTKIDPDKKTVLFLRKNKGNRQDKYSGKFFQELENNQKGKKAELSQMLAFASKGTRKNQPFLTSLFAQDIKVFLPVYNWFCENLQFIHPNGYFDGAEGIFDEKNQLFKEMDKLIGRFDAGVGHLKVVQKKSDFGTSRLGFMKEGESFRIGGIRPTAITRQNDEYLEKEIEFYHHDESGDSVKFDYDDESDGTKRLFNVLPAFLELLRKNSGQVFVFDELDRSMHSRLTRRLLDFYLNKRKKDERSQIIFTTHDTVCMTLDLFRRDEIWFTERKRDNSTQFFSLCQFTESEEGEKDGKLLESYLLGVLGGVPDIRPLGASYDQVRND